MRILLVGVGGQVGHEPYRVLMPLGDVVVPPRQGDPGQPGLDLADPDRLADVVAAIDPDWIVNAGAYTAVDAAEGDAERAHSINARAPGALAAAAERTGAAILHFSTDYVFDLPRGHNATSDSVGARAPWRESDTPRPRSVYGQTKLAGEQAVAAATGRHLTLRTSWVYGARGRNFALTMRDLASAGRPLRVVADQHGAPTWSRALAQVAGYLVQVASGRDATWWARHGGLYHVSAPDHATWHAFAQYIVASSVGARAAEAIEPISTVDWPTPAPRPAWSVLDSGLLKARFGLALPPWREQADAMLMDLNDK